MRHTYAITAAITWHKAIRGGTNEGMLDTNKEARIVHEIPVTQRHCLRIFSSGFFFVLTTPAYWGSSKFVHLRVTNRHNEANWGWSSACTRHSFKTRGCNSTASHIKPKGWLRLRLCASFYSISLFLCYFYVICFTVLQQFTVIHEDCIRIIQLR